ncbi:uncharacterized protein LOC128862239 [Anastrepha ludens]|uniref:uncharacterized protein LOC128862239 n=1 Tax=Anastrepha ludens TaxID=28586 RepID=UPI0023AFA9F6|nr:uncharacterized protein LOC128862239 [Anastrepha ludens]XP_053956734.1 uncharacterized protein LOC128862239 [Anastrepha ludens]
MDTDPLTVVNIENGVPDENDIWQAHIQEESANTNTDDTAFCIKTEGSYPNDIASNNGTIDIDDDTTFVVSNPQTVDDFIIYELNEMDCRVLGKNSKFRVNPTGRFPRKRPKVSDISQRSFRLDKGPILKKREQAAPRTTNTTSGLIRIMSSERNDNLTSTNDFHYNNEHMATQKLTVLPSRQISENHCAMTIKEVTSSATIDGSVTKKKGTSFKQKFPKIKEFWEMSDTVTTKVPRNPETLVLKNNKSPIKICTKPAKKPLASYSELEKRCDCHIYPVKGAEAYTTFELKDFFEEMFEKTRKLSIERRQMVKMELLKAVCRAEEDVEAGNFCEKCYTILAQSKNN